MTITHQYQYVVTDGAVRVNVTEQINASSSVALEESVPDAASDLQINVAVQEADLTSFALVATQDVTVKTNSAGAPQETINLKANRPLIWGTGGGAKPIAGDLSALFVSNSSGTDATIKLIAGWDATP